MRRNLLLLAFIGIAGTFRSCCAQDAAAPASATPAAPAKSCKSALDLIAAQNMNLPLHPVFQNIFNSEDLKGTIFIPTTEAWDAFFTTMRQRRGNPAAPAMVARYGQILLYHLAKDVQVPVAEPTPGISKFAVDTASTLQCTFGPDLPNNRLIISKTPRAILIQHGTGNATIVSQKIPYCGGDAFLVDQVLVPCSDIAAVMAEVTNIPSPCKSNVEAALHENKLSYFNALLLATGVQRPIFNSVRDFTLFAPSDAAVQNAYRSGAFNYPDLFANNRTILEGIVAFHAVPQYQFAAPSKQTLSMRTLLTEGTGEANCDSPSLSWRGDGFVYGGTGSARASASAARGCNTQIRVIEEVLQPCCKPMAELLGGESGLAAQAPEDSIQAKAYDFLLSRVKNGAAGTSFVMPSAEAWAQFELDAQKQKVNLTDARLEALFSYLLTTKPVTSQAISLGSQIPTRLAADAKATAAVCPKGSTASLIFNADESAELPAAPEATATAAAQPAAATGPVAAAAVPAAAAPQLPGAASVVSLQAAPAPVPSAITAPGLGRRLQQASATAAAAAAAPDATASGDLLLPTSYVEQPPVEGAVGLTSAVAGPLVLIDGQEMELESGMGIPIISMTAACDGVIYNTDAVPLPCNLLNRTVVVPPPVAPLAANITEVLPAQAAADAAAATDAPAVAAAASAAAVAVVPVLLSSLTALLLAAVML